MTASRQRKRPPKYCQNKATGRAYVTVNGRRIYLGAFGSDESYQQYESVLAQLRAGEMPGIDRKRGDPELTIDELVQVFQAHAKQHYRKHGQLTSEYSNYAQAARPLRALYGGSPAVKFGPLALKAVRQRMVDSGWSRKNINKQVSRVRSIFRWAAENELIPEHVHTGLTKLSGLRRGKTEARESQKVRPVPQAQVDAIRPHVSRQVFALIQLQCLTGARAGELVGIRAVDIDTSSAVWTYAPPDHKTAHHDHERFIYFGPRAQAVMRPFMADRPVDAYLFSPREAEAERLAQRH